MNIPISSIKVPDRFRSADPKAAGAMVESFKKFGQLSPIIVTEDHELVAGLHRLRAAQFLGWKEIRAETKESLTELTRREIELEENIRRLDMSWYDRARAIAEIDRLRREEDPKWSQEMTAVAAGTKRQADVSEAVNIVKMAELFPELKDAKSLHQAKSWALSKAASVVRITEVKSNPAEFQEIEEKIWLGDSVEAIKRVPSEHFDLVLTDPPFGIGYDKRKAGEGSVSAYQDDEESYRRILSMAPDLYRVVKPDGWLVWFLGISWYERAKNTFREAGFTVDEIPIVWVRTAGRCYTARPDRYFARGYDLALHALKGNPEMVVRNRPNVFDFPPVPDSEQTLLVERPIDLYKEIIKHLTHPGERVADFFVGSGSVPAAAAELSRDYFGVELDPERRAVALKKIRAHTPDANRA